MILASETIEGVHAQNKVLTRTVDGINRSSGYQLGTSGNADQDMKVVFWYVTNDGRLAQIDTTSYEDDSEAFTYSYESTGQLAPTLLVGENVGGPPDDQHMYTSFNYMSDVDVLNYIQNKETSGGGIVSKYDYDYNNIGLRTKKTLSGTAFTETTYDAYDYNSRHELTASVRKYTGHTPVSGKYFSYSYDNIGNRSGWYDGSGNGGDFTEYTPTHLNQYSGITGKHVESPIDYDDDGNLIELDNFEYIYDGENRLIAVEEDGSPLVSFEYDYLGRRTEKSVSGGSTYTYLYDGWNLIAVYNTSDNLPVITYTWGLDLSHSIQGAGGVGGLLMSYESSDDAWSYYQDGHGNVSQVIDQDGGGATVKMEYDPYGRVISGSPGTGLRDVFRFSSKYYDSETGLYYYGYRYYDPEHGRWLNRDPIGERGGLNLYVFVSNSGINNIDILGLIEVEVKYSPPEAAKTPVTYLKTKDNPRTEVNERRIEAVRAGFGINLLLGNNAQTSFSGGKVECDCKDKLITCNVTFSANIVIDLLSGGGHTVRGVLGHEQRHVLSMIQRVKNEIVDALDKKTFPEGTNGDREAFFLQGEFGRKLKQLLANPGEDHSDPQDKLEVPPASGVEHDPLDGTPNLPPEDATLPFIK